MSPLHLCDLSSGMVAGQAMLAALYAREVTGEGSYIDTSMFRLLRVVELAARFPAGASTAASASARTWSTPRRPTTSTRPPTAAKLALGMVEAKFWEPFCDAIGASRDQADGSHARVGGRPRRSRSCARPSSPRTTAEWMEWLEDKDFCIAKVNSKTEAVEQITRENPEALAWVEFPRVGPACFRRVCRITSPPFRLRFPSSRKCRRSALTRPSISRRLEPTMPRSRA